MMMMIIVSVLALPAESLILDSTTLLMFGDAISMDGHGRVAVVAREIRCGMQAKKTAVWPGS